MIPAHMCRELSVWRECSFLWSLVATWQKSLKLHLNSALLVFPKPAACSFALKLHRCKVNELLHFFFQHFVTPPLDSVLLVGRNWTFFFLIFSNASPECLTCTENSKNVQLNKWINKRLINQINNRLNEWMNDGPCLLHNSPWTVWFST